jgi:magnesium transporter
MYYLIRDTLTPCGPETLRQTAAQYVAVLTPEEWLRQRDSFDMGIELEPELLEIHNTKAEVNYDSLTGTFLVPDRADIAGNDFRFAFALDEKGVVFIDGSGVVERLLDNIIRTKKWRLPSLERFLYDFLEQIIKDDLALMERYEQELDAMELTILQGEPFEGAERLNEIRGDIRDLRNHYEQLTDLGGELEENENNFFKADNLRYFRLFLNRVDRLHDAATSIRDYTMQIRDLHKTQLDVKQNNIITVLTIVTTIFMPLTLIAGWYGMNFRYMPELNSPLGYPVVIAVSVAIVVLSLIFFKKKKWL